MILWSHYRRFHHGLNANCESRSVAQFRENLQETIRAYGLYFSCKLVDADAAPAVEAITSTRLIPLLLPLHLLVFYSYENVSVKVHAENSTIDNVMEVRRFEANRKYQKFQSASLDIVFYYLVDIAKVNNVF